MDKLQKRYGLLTAICMVVGIVIGSGVFFKAQTILQKTGGNMPLGILAWIIGGVIMLTCLLAFWLGMLFIRYRSILTKWQLVIPAAVCAVILLFFPLGADMLLCMQFTSIALFFVFYFVGNYVMKIKYVNSFIRYSSKISYAVFLLQHVVMSEVIHAFDNYALTIKQELLVLLAVFAAIYVLAAVLMVLNRALLGTRPFQVLDAFFGKTKEA